MEAPLGPDSLRSPSQHSFTLSPDFFRLVPQIKEREGPQRFPLSTSPPAERSLPYLMKLRAPSGSMALTDPKATPTAASSFTSIR